MNDEYSGTSLKGLILDMIPRDVAFLQGTVTSVTPLKIQIDNDSKLVIGSISTIIPQHLTNYTISITDGGIQRTVTVHNALSIGEKVHLLTAQGGKKYFVLGRV